jgi:2-C-methyl-D-erythritol 2,4-cyclodiphosphate synthase
VPSDRAAIAHSDGDVLIHALIDALLGAVGRGDIGEHFPDSDPSNRGRDSCEMLRVVWESLGEGGWQLVNIDCVIVLERPRLAPYKEKIRETLAAILGIGADRINVKAKTAEGVGPVGEGKVVEAHVVALLTRAGG